ncbi:C2 domain-containing protein, partial [Cristinia sonorae]
MTNDLGTLVVVVLKARNLPDKHTFYKQDVFGQIQIHDVTKKTAVDIKGGQHPVWDEELRVPVPAKASDVTRTLHVSCWSQESRGPEEIGKGKVDITETLKTGEFDDWVPLEVDGKYRGEMYLEMTFYAAGPPPALSRRPSKLLPKDRLAKP